MGSDGYVDRECMDVDEVSRVAPSRSKNVGEPKHDSHTLFNVQGCLETSAPDDDQFDRRRLCDASAPSCIRDNDLTSKHSHRNGRDGRVCSDPVISSSSLWIAPSSTSTNAPNYSTGLIHSLNPSYTPLLYGKGCSRQASSVNLASS